MATVELFRYGHAKAPEWQTAAESCLSQLEPLPPGANLGFLYVLDGLSGRMEDLVRFFKGRTSVEHWVGTVGIGICGTGVEYYEEPAIAVLVTSFREESFRIIPSIVSDLDAFEREHGRWCEQARPYFGVVHGDPRNVGLPGLVAQLAERMGNGFLVGGLASSRSEYVQVADEVTHGGLSGVLFTHDVAVTTRLTQGCSPIGPRHEITRCDQNVIIELDGRPVLDVFREDIGEVLARDLTRTAGYIFAGLPIPGCDTGDYVVRNLMGVDIANSLLAIGEFVEAGNTLMFCRRDAQEARQDMHRMLQEIKTGLTGEPKGGVYYSCVGRGANLFGSDSEELKLIEAELGRFPLVGFYANGEISNDRLYGYTGVLTLFT